MHWVVAELWGQRMMNKYVEPPVLGHHRDQQRRIWCEQCVRHACYPCITIWCRLFWQRWAKEDDGESDTGLDVLMSCLEEAKKVIAGVNLSLIAQLLVSRHLLSSYGILQIDSKCVTHMHCSPLDSQCSAAQKHVLYCLSNGCRLARNHQQTVLPV